MRTRFMARAGGLALVGASLAAAAPPMQTVPDAGRLKTGRFTYGILDKGRDAGRIVIGIRRGDRGSYVFTADVTGDFSQQWESIASASFEPRSARLQFGSGAAIRPAFELEYAADRVGGFRWARGADPADKRPVAEAVPKGIIDQRIDWAAAIAGDLDAGRTFELAVYDPGSGVSRLTARVLDAGLVRVPAGSFEARRVVYRINSATESREYRVLTTVAAPRMMVREEFPGGVVSDLLKVEEEVGSPVRERR